MTEAEKPKAPGGALYLISAVVVIAVIWGWYLLEHFTNLRVVRAGGTAQAEPLHLAFPLAATPVVLVVALALWRRAVGIVENGVPADAVIESIGGEFQGYRDVVFEYSFDGRSYSQKKSVVGVVVERLNPGDRLAIVVDRRNPKRVVVRNVQKPAGAVGAG